MEGRHVTGNATNSGTINVIGSNATLNSRKSHSAGAVAPCPPPLRGSSGQEQAPRISLILEAAELSWYCQMDYFIPKMQVARISGTETKKPDILVH